MKSERARHSSNFVHLGSERSQPRPPFFVWRGFPEPEGGAAGRAGEGATPRPMTGTPGRESKPRGGHSGAKPKNGPTGGGAFALLHRDSRFFALFHACPAGRALRSTKERERRSHSFGIRPGALPLVRGKVSIFKPPRNPPHFPRAAMCKENLAHDAQPRQRPDQGELDQGNRRGGPDPGGMSCGKNRKAQGRRDAFMGWPMNGAAMRPRPGTDHRAAIRARLPLANGRDRKEQAKEWNARDGSNRPARRAELRSIRGICPLSGKSRHIGGGSRIPILQQ